MKLTVAADTPLGVVFHTFTTKGKGVLIVERFQEHIAELEGCEVAEVEIVNIVDDENSHILWPREAWATRCSGSTKAETAQPPAAASTA